MANKDLNKTLASFLAAQGHVPNGPCTPPSPCLRQLKASKRIYCLSQPTPGGRTGLPVSVGGWSPSLDKRRLSNPHEFHMSWPPFPVFCNVLLPDFIQSPLIIPPFPHSPLQTLGTSAEIGKKLSSFPYCQEFLSKICFQYCHIQLCFSLTPYRRDDNLHLQCKAQALG